MAAGGHVMTTIIAFALLGLALAVVVGIGVVLYRRRGGVAAAEQRARGRALDKHHRAMSKTHTGAIKVAAKSLARAQSARDRRLAVLQGELAQLQSPDGRRLGTYRGVVLNELSIVTPQGSSGLTGASATVDTAGNLAVTRRATLTRTVAGGILFGPVGAVIGGAGFKKAKQHDARELYLMIDTPSLVAVVECPADQGVRARAFAAEITTAARQSEAVLAARPHRIVDVQARLAAEHANTAEIEQGQGELERVRNDEQMLTAIETARRAVEQHAREVGTPGRELTSG